MTGPGRVASLARASGHGFSKRIVPALTLIAGEGVEGDAHRGVTVKHRSRVRVDPTQPNLRQVHLIPSETLARLTAAGFPLAPGDLGENILTEGLDLHALPRGARLAFPSGATVEVTGLRNPCGQIEDFRPGLLAHVLWREGDALIRRAGIMGIVLAGGDIRQGDAIAVALPAPPHAPLDRV